MLDQECAQKAIDKSESSGNGSRRREESWKGTASQHSSSIAFAVSETRDGGVNGEL